MLLEIIQQHTIQAMKEHDVVQVTLLKTIKGEVERAPDKNTSDEAVLKVLKKMKESIVLIPSPTQERELEIIDFYLPKPLTNEQMDEIINQIIISQNKELTIKDFGLLMKEVGKVNSMDMKYASQKLKEVFST